MPKFLIERNIPDVGKLTPEQLTAASQTSCSVLRNIGPEIQWVQSYVTANKLFCVYIAPSEEMAFCTDWEEPLPTATSRITDPTPIKMPSVVSAERSLFAASPASANRKIWTGLTAATPPGAGAAGTRRPR